jgi:4-carboxymuconolactone decarboxylase
VSGLDGDLGRLRDADIWCRPGLEDRDRRLLLIGLLAGTQQHDVLRIQVPAALGNGELSADELREVVILLAHYAGWPTGAALHTIVEGAITEDERDG